MRSHAVPIYPERFLPAAQQMGEGPPRRTFLSTKTAQRQYTKNQDGAYFAHDSTARSFVEMSTAATTITQRFQKSASYFPGSELLATLREEQWAAVNEAPPARHPALHRSLPYPNHMPAYSFEELDALETMGATARYLRQNARRQDAFREIMASDEMLAELMGHRR